MVLRMLTYLGQVITFIAFSFKSAARINFYNNPCGAFLTIISFTKVYSASTASCSCRTRRAS